MTILIILLTPLIIKLLWVIYERTKQEKKDVIQRANYLVSKVATSPKQLLSKMPNQIGNQFQGEWAIYSCSMTCKALSNIASLYPEYKQFAVNNISKIIDIALSKEIREYDQLRWNEDPIKGLNGHLSHLSYYSHLAWMIGEYRTITNNNQYDKWYHMFCSALVKRITESSVFNLPTYPHECIYVPDMLVAIVALDKYSRFYNGKYQDTIKKWIWKAKTEWIEPNTGLLASFIINRYGKSKISPNIKGSYSALNSYYLSLIDKEFGRQQYQLLKTHFKTFFGIKEYHNKRCIFGFDIDAGPIILNLSPSGTAFIIGCATIFNDRKFRRQLLTTAEIAGNSISHKKKTHYLLANIALVGEAITLAMRTSYV